jgi:hypothetical protein
MGYSAMGNVVQAISNVAIGPGAMNNAGGSSVLSYNIVLGTSAGANLGAGGTSAVSNVMIGTSCGSSVTNSSNYNTWIGGFNGPNVVLNRTVVISDGYQYDCLMDYGVTSSSPYVWSLGYNFSFYNPAGLHLYNTQDSAAVATNYERAILDWNPTANIFRIGSQAGGTGTVRLIAIDGFQKAGAPAAGDLPSGTCALINDTSGGATWLCYNAAGTIRKVQLT